MQQLYFMKHKLISLFSRKLYKIITQQAVFIFVLLFFASFKDPKKPLNPYPQGYFQSPVAHEMKLGGSFGELRAGHFHSGIDISPAPKQDNEPIFAAAEGYVSRIGIQEGGYGQVLYITHPNGYTTVYGHLEKFIPQIRALVRKKQYETERFVQDIVLQPTEIPISRGQQIALMGNRGHSFGEHLHFEIRETATGHTINPLLFGLTVIDNIPPSIRNVKVYFLDEKREVIDTKILNLVKKANGYGIVGDTLNTPSPFVALAVKTYDSHNGKSGDNGIYSMELFDNENPIYKFKAERFSFDETRYLNAHLDYFEQTHRGGYYHRAFKLRGNKLSSMYENVVDNGVLKIGETAKNIQIKISDVQGNSSFLRFTIRTNGSVMTSMSKSYTYKLPYNEASLINMNGARFFFKEGCFYDDIYLNSGVTTEGGSYGVYSPTYLLSEDRSPMHYSMAISIKPINLPDSLKSKAFIGYCPRGGSKTYNCGGTWKEDGFLTTKNSQFGSYCIMADLTPPSIQPLSFQYDMRKSGKMSFKIKDNYETEGSADGLTYRATIDDKWFLMEFDSKSDYLFHKFETDEMLGEHILRLSVKDNRGNETVYEGKFKR
jgi:murein DD-endopeptidase MepM/ murein hydrolase activator NlpD